GLDFLLGLSSLAKGEVLEEQRVGIEARSELRTPLQIGLGERYRRKLARADAFAQPPDGEVEGILGDHGRPPPVRRCRSRAGSSLFSRWKARTAAPGFWTFSSIS